MASFAASDEFLKLADIANTRNLAIRLCGRGEGCNGRRCVKSRNLSKFFTVFKRVMLNLRNSFMQFLRSAPPSPQQVPALLVFGLGLYVMLGWLLKQPAMVQLHPGQVAMVFNTAFCFAITGFALLAVFPKREYQGVLFRVTGILISVLGALNFAENLFGHSYGIDWRGMHSWLTTDANPNAGRMAPNTALAMFLLGLVFLLMSGRISKWQVFTSQLFTLLVVGIGLTGLVGYTVDLQSLYSWFRAARMAPLTAVGVIVLGVAVWLTLDRLLPENFVRDDERIRFVNAAVLILMVVTASLGSFAILQQSLEQSLSEKVVAALERRSAVFDEQVIQSIRIAKSSASRADLVRAVDHKDAINSKEPLHEILHNMLGLGFSAIAIDDQYGNPIISEGDVELQPELQLSLAGYPNTELRWIGQMAMATRLPIMNQDQLVGFLRVVLPLPLVTRQMVTIFSLGVSGEVGLCATASNNEIACFPQTRQPRAYREPRLNKEGALLPMGLALAGSAGVTKAQDYRGNQVLAAYKPVMGGFGMVVKQDTAELYAPIRIQLQKMFAVMAFMVFAGIWVLRWQVRPLVEKLVKSEQVALASAHAVAVKEEQVRTVVETAGEGIITMDDRGLIVSFNSAATRIFGHQSDAIIGRNVMALMPEEMRQPYEKGLHRLLEASESRVMGKQGVEVLGLRHDGTVFPIELTVSEMKLGERRMFVGIVKDISQRKHQEAVIFEEKERLRVTLSSIADAVITTDTAGHVTYLNPIAEMMTGWRNQDACGLPLPKIFRIVHQTNREIAPNPVDQVLQGAESAGLASDTMLIRFTDAAEFAIEDSAAPIRDRKGQVIGVVLVFHDVSQARQLAAEITHQATHDGLTGLINRKEFERRLLSVLESGQADKKSHTVLYLDLDQFKVVNDTCGHVAGDQLLKQITGLLEQKLRDSDTFARLGGDEFGVLLPGCPLKSAMLIAEQLRQTVCDFRFVWQDKTFPIGVSIGLVTVSNECLTVSDVLKFADSACYVAKERGRNRIHVYEPDDGDIAQRAGEMGWYGRVHAALRDNRFVLLAQPILPLGRATQTIHAEVLLRMIDENGAPVLPMAFIPAAERYNLMPAVDKWVIHAALSFLSARLAEGKSNIELAINLSGQSLNDEKFPIYLAEEFELLKVPYSAVCFEITETAAVANFTQAAQFIHHFKQLGCRFALDDFGSGMSSFAYLKHLPVDVLKIDGTFVKDIAEDSIDLAMVEAINKVGHAMGMQTIAEFVESEEILIRLQALGVDYAQGYYIGRPKPILELCP